MIDSISDGKVKMMIVALHQRLNRVRSFLKTGVWDADLAVLPVWRAVGVRLLRVVLLVFRGFKDDECAMHASALTFSTLMAIVPILALCLSMARGLGDADTAKRWIQDRVQDWTKTFKVEPQMAAPDAHRTDGVDIPEEFVQGELAIRINTLVEKGFEKVENINFARLGTVGLILLIWMVIEVLGRVERSFNRVWGITIGRSVWRRFTDYLSVLLILPILIVAAASLPIMEGVTRYMPADTAVLFERFVASGLFKNGVVLLMTTLVFAFMIMFMPNTTMKLNAGLTGGFVSAILFLVWLSICAMIQVGAARYGKIYGSFAVAPIVLAWVHVSWQIVLFGAEVAFSVQNCETFRMEQNAGDANVRARLLLALSVTKEAARSMLSEVPLFNLEAYGHQHRIPVRLLHAVVDELVRTGILAGVAERPGVYVLLKAPSVLTIGDILNGVLDTGAGVRELGLGHLDADVRKAVEGAFKGMHAGVALASVDTLLAGETKRMAG
ncbi:MAG TPA: hypothetical protein DCS43_07455 [Verrucomicrobia bacterium]|nr:hypothetical protein [Verrucomicrobiota bacterium]